VKGKRTSFPFAVVFLALTSTAMATTTWYVAPRSHSQRHDNLEEL